MSAKVGICHPVPHIFSLYKYLNSSFIIFFLNKKTKKNGPSTVISSRAVYLWNKLQESLNFRGLAIIGVELSI